MTRHSGSYSPSGWWTQDASNQAAGARARLAQERYAALLDQHHNALMLGGHPEVADLSAAEIIHMSMSDFGRLRERAGLANPAPAVAGDVAAAAEVRQPQHLTGHPGTEFADMTMRDYQRVRDQLGIGRSNSARGIFGN